MGQRNRESLTRQVEKTLVGMLRTGESRHAAKQAAGWGKSTPGIYSYTTLQGYMDKCVRFTQWAKAEHGCRTLEDCRPHTAEYLQTCKSASTAAAVRSALAKLYGCKGEELGAVPARHRADITRSRGAKAMDRHFSEERNADLVAFCRATGLRRSELRSLRGSDLERRDGQLCVHVRSGKGGRERWAPVIGDTTTVTRMCQTAGDGHVFQRIHAAADIHNYRAEYATAIYTAHARTLAECKAAGEVYWCRGDRKGEWMDRQAMKLASEALGHSRISVVGEHYIRR